MSFRTRKGRPRRADAGCMATPELLEKRRQQQTMDPLDRALSAGWINEQQRDIALRLRWLHTLFFGVPGVTAIDLREEVPEARHEGDEVWLAERRQDYNAALKTLNELKIRNEVTHICIYAMAEESDYMQQNLFEHKHHGLRRSLAHGLDSIHDQWRKMARERSNLTKESA